MSGAGGVECLRLRMDASFCACGHDLADHDGDGCSCCICESPEAVEDEQPLALWPATLLHHLRDGLQHLLAGH